MTVMIIETSIKVVLITEKLINQLITTLGSDFFISALCISRNISEKFLMSMAQYFSVNVL